MKHVSSRRLRQVLRAMNLSGSRCYSCPRHDFSCFNPTYALWPSSGRGRFSRRGTEVVRLDRRPEVLRRKTRSQVQSTLPLPLTSARRRVRLGFHLWLARVGGCLVTVRAVNKQSRHLRQRSVTQALAAHFHFTDCDRLYSSTPTLFTWKYSTLYYLVLFASHADFTSKIYDHLRKYDAVLQVNSPRVYEIVKTTAATPLNCTSED